MFPFLENCVAGPNAVATILLIMVVLYWLTMIFTGLGFDGPELDVDVDADADLDVLSFGGAALKWFNIGRVPLMIWISIFSISFWAISVTIPLPNKDMTFWFSALLVLRNGALAMIPTKLLSQPLAGKFDAVETNRLEDLLGLIGVAKTEITPAKGQAEFPSSAAPLLLSVRTKQGVIGRGEEVEIVGFDEETDLHLVEKATKKKSD